MNPVYTYKCGRTDADGNPAPHYHDRPGKLGEPPPERVTCPECGRAAGRYYGKAPAVIWNAGGGTGAGRKAR